jgi:protease I
MRINLYGKRVAILIGDFFEEGELTGPLKAVTDAGAEVDIISACPAINMELQGMNHVEKGKMYKVDKTLEQADIDDYDALIVPGGAANADKLRAVGKANDWVRTSVKKGKPLAVICHAPWILASAGVAEGRRLTSYPTIAEDLICAGADWLDEEVVIDGAIITSRKGSDIPAFNHALLTLMA